MKYDVFISYRRSTGAYMAEQLKMVLRQRHYKENRIFMDTYSLGAGNYVEDLEKAIKDSMNVVVLVTMDCFKGLSENSNWTREITTALKLGKNVVPMYFDGITEVSPDELPDCMKNFPQTNAVIYSPHYVEPSYDRLCSLLKTDYGYIRKRILTVVGSVMAAGAVIAGAYFGGIAIKNAIERAKTVEVVEEEEEVRGLVVSEDPVLVDLGLPSGTLWLDRNIGADKFSDFGDYYAFWETFVKKSYKPSSKGIRYDKLDLSKLQRKDYDVAWAKSQGEWCLPSDEQYAELVALCDWEYAEYDGVSGRLVTGPNGYAIFLPAAGMWNSEELQYENEYGYYWTSTLAPGNNGRYGRELIFAPNQQVGNGREYCGRSVRPVGIKKADRAEE